MIRFDKVTKRYQNGYVALKNVNFCLEKGELVFLTGHSGAGKTSLLKLISRITEPSQGQVIVNGQNLKHMSQSGISKLRRSIGMVLQDPHLLMEKTVLENVAMPLIIASFHGKEIKRRVRAALEKVGLSSKEKMTPIELSSGEQQRVAIARAIVHKPTLLLADEPTGNLDPKLSKEIMKTFLQLNELGVSVLLASHDLALIACLQHRIMTLRQGVLVGDGGIGYE